jgi:hypothetical protein
MNPKELRNFQEAYFDIYEQDEILGEAEVMKHQKERSAIERRKKMKGYEPPTKGVHGEIERRQAQKPPSKLRSGSLPESYDLYDIILSHLIDEGYADTEDAAEAIMVNMSEEWKEEILDEAITSEKDKEGAAEMAEADSIAAMRERAAKRRKQRYGASDTSRGGRDDFAPITDYAAADKKWARPHVQKESFNVFVNSMIAEGVSMESYTWKEIQNVFDDIFEAQVANRNPDEYERKAKQGQSREQQLKGKVMGRMSQMDPEKRKKMLAQMRAVGLDV